MKYLILSNMYPSKEMPYTGIFVKNQYTEISRLKISEESVDIKYLLGKRTGSIGSMLKYGRFFLKTFPLYFKKYNVIHLHYFFPLGIIPFIYKKVHPSCKVIITFHGSDVYNFMANKIIRFFFKPIAKNADCLIVVGKDLGEDIEKILDVKPHRVISAGVDKNVFYKEKVQKKYDFLFVGSFVERKGLDLFCDAIRKRNITELAYCFVGAGPLEGLVKNLQNEGYNITIKKNQTQHQLRRIYNQSKWFLFPSRNEPFGLVVTESIFCGTPVITSGVGGIKEQIKEGNNGYFLADLKIDEINKTMDYVLAMNEKDYKVLVQNCLNSNQQYALEPISQELLEIYRQN